VSTLSTRFWVDAYLTRLRLSDIPAFVTAHGDDMAGSVLIKLNTLDGQAQLFQRMPDLMTGEHAWSALHKGLEAEIDQSVTKQKSFDPDLWVIEVEDRAARHLLDEPGLC
jgi:hypothetical protein